MPFCAVLALLLLLIAALGQSWWWRVPAGPWYGSAAFYWGVFFLALFLTWPTLKAMGL